MIEQKKCYTCNQDHYSYSSFAIAHRDPTQEDNFHWWFNATTKVMWVRTENEYVVF